MSLKSRAAVWPSVFAYSFNKASYAVKDKPTLRNMRSATIAAPISSSCKHQFNKCVAPSAGRHCPISSSAISASRSAPGGPESAAACKSSANARCGNTADGERGAREPSDAFPGDMPIQSSIVVESTAWTTRTRRATAEASWSRRSLRASPLKAAVALVWGHAPCGSFAKRSFTAESSPTAEKAATATSAARASRAGSAPADIKRLIATSRPEPMAAPLTAPCKEMAPEFFQ
mmetsp:Transcript_75798/g.218878  ORF Transcript_75798/g.218878 Transcript_75798/m.218878 type:complete len:232 (+) Transcript_75798:2241-2936(+)